MAAGQNFHNLTQSARWSVRLGVGKKELVTVTPDQDLLETARLMREKNIGDVLVVEEKNGSLSPVGILTDRDIALATAGEGINPSQLKASDIMTRSLVTATVSDGVFDMIQLMKDHGVTRLPIIAEDGSAVGIITARRLLQLLIQGLDDLTRISERQKQEFSDRH